MKKGLGFDVLTAARERIRWVFANFPRIYLSFSGGKDSGVMLHLVMDEAISRGRKIGVLFVDFEAQYKLTIDYIAEMYELYAGHIDPFWVALPISLRNAVSQFEPQWTCWDPARSQDWVRRPHPLSITDQKYFPFYRYAMEFEDFTPDFGSWYSNGLPTACFVGIRSDESLNRYRTIASGKKQAFDGRQWTTWLGGGVWNVYPIYDWRTEDIWTYYGKLNRPYNHLYDRMHQAGLSIHQARICQPYGDDQRKGLWLFQVIEPETWAKVLARVNGANQGAMYARESGNILGRMKISKPPGHTWESFAKIILESMPPATRNHYENKIAVFLHWYQERGFTDGIPDFLPESIENVRSGHPRPSWRRICKALLRNDYWCKGLSFSQHKSGAYEKYKKLMRRRREEWGII